MQQAGSESDQVAGNERAQETVIVRGNDGLQGFDRIACLARGVQQVGAGAEGCVVTAIKTCG